MLAGTLQRSRLNKIELADHTYFYAVNGPIISVLEADPSDESESRIYQMIAQRLARSFLDRYPESFVTNWSGECETFQGFRDQCSNICNEFSPMMRQSQREFITQYFYEAAKDSNVLGIVVFDLVKDEVLSSDIPQDFSVQDFEAFGSMLFSFLTRLAKELKAGEINEILLRAKNYWIGGFKRGDLAVFMLFAQDYFGKVLPEFVSTPLATSGN